MEDRRAGDGRLLRAIVAEELDPHFEVGNRFYKPERIPNLLPELIIQLENAPYGCTVHVHYGACGCFALDDTWWGRCVGACAAPWLSCTRGLALGIAWRNRMFERGYSRLQAGKVVTQLARKMSEEKHTMSDAQLQSDRKGAAAILNRVHAKRREYMNINLSAEGMV